MSTQAPPATAAAPGPASATAPRAAAIDNVHVQQSGALVLTGPRRRELQRANQAVQAALLRAIDFIVASALLIVLLPILLAAAVFIRLDSPGPSFYRSRRVGYRGRELRMLKFRKMVVGAKGVPLTSSNDSRFTRAGGILAKFKLDEIPQLWHVVRGEMSLVGPRPEDPVFVEQHRDAFEPILKVRPGITGLSQIAFVEESRILDTDDPLEHYIGRLLPQKIGLDQLYATRRGLSLNFRILFWTLAAVILRRNVAVYRESGKMRLRRR
jgi:lipopolysaccharide/colanic/teichoic acid biosynthesis glycosyltransferase